VKYYLKWTAPVLWLGAVAGIWLLPVRAVVVLTGAAITGTWSAMSSATDDRITAHDVKFRTLFGVMSNVTETMGIASDGCRLHVVRDHDAEARLGVLAVSVALVPLLIGPFLGGRAEPLHRAGLVLVQARQDAGQGQR
jgi:hypothetical protein